MIHKSPFKEISIPECNILSYLFPKGKEPSTRPLWRDAKSPDLWLSPASLLRLVQRFASGLDLLGIPTNTAIMVFTPNHIFVPVAYLGATGSKRYYTGANPAYSVGELAHQMTLVNPAVVLIHPSLFKSGYAAIQKAKVLSTKVFLFSDIECPDQNGIRDWRTFLAPELDAASWEWDELGRDARDQIATINFSSGTTGLPKGVCISHYNLVANSTQTTEVKLSRPPHKENGTGDNDVWLAFLPLYHAFSQQFTINVACRMQASVYIMQSFNFKDFLNYIQRYKVTTIQAVPPVMNMLAKRTETAQYDLSSLKNIMVGAAPLSIELSNDLMRRFDFFIARGWGMTETTCVGALMPDNVHNTDGASGYLLPNTEAKLVDENGDEVTDTCTPGEMWIRGPQIMSGYWQNVASTSETCTSDGWLKTGDVVVFKNDLCYVVDRKKEMIKVNGIQVAPAEIEAILVDHNLVSDAAVVGLLVDGNEHPRAYVVLQSQGSPQTSLLSTDLPDPRAGLSPRKILTERDIQSYVEKTVAKHKRLTGGVCFVEAIPRLQSGKIMRSKVKAWAKRDALSFKARSLL